MKRLADLTPDEKRIIVAEFEGWSIRESEQFKHLCRPNTTEGFCCGKHLTDAQIYTESFDECGEDYNVPNYCSDQNAIIAACGKLDMAQEDLFAVHLYHLAIPVETQYPDHFISWKIAKILINATAEQRTNALILTIGKATL